jgi:hypothetical protein
MRAAKNCMSAQAAVTAHAIQSGVTMTGIAGDQAIERLTEAESRFQTLLGLGLTENQSRS